MIADAFFIRKNMMKLRLGTKEIMKKKLIDHALKSEEKGKSDVYVQCIGRISK